MSEWIMYDTLDLKANLLIIIDPSILLLSLIHI